MARFDHLWIDPTGEEVEFALAQAAEVAHEGVGGRMDWPQAGLADELASAARAPEGHRQWLASELPTIAAREKPGVGLAWWTDHLGRRHHRFVAGPVSLRTDRPQSVFGTKSWPAPLALVYPERVVCREKDGARALLALCDCGALGPPEALGWMGTCCGPCHDRREEGAPPPPGPRTALYAAGVSAWRMVWWGADGQALVTRGAPHGKAHVWRTHTGAVEALACPYPVTSLATAPAPGLVALGLAQRVRVLGRDGWCQDLGGPGDRQTVSLAFSPDASLLAAAGENGLIVWRLADSRALLKGRQATQVLGFTPDGQALTTFDSTGGVHLRNLKTGEARHLPVADRHRLGELKLSPDGRWLPVGDWYWGGQFHLRRLDLPQAPAPQPPPRDPTGDVAYTPDSSVMAYVELGGGVQFWGLEAARALGSLGLLGPVPTALAFSPDGRWLAVGAEGWVLLWPWRELLGVGAEAGRA